MDKLAPVELDFIFNNAEFKAASEQLKAEITGIVDTAKVAAEGATQATAVVLSDSAKEIEEFQRKLAESAKMTGPLVESKGIEEAKRQLELLVAEKARLQEFYAAGKIGAESYQDAVDKLAASERQLTAAVAGQAPNQQGAEVKALNEKERALMAVSDEYRGVLAAGMSAYNELTPATRTLIIQLNDMDQEMRQVNGAQNDLNKRFDMGTIDANQYSQALAALSVREAELRKNIQGATTDLKGQSVAIAAQKPKWNGLGNSINQISRELPAFTYSAQTGFMAIANNIPILSDEIGRLKKENEALVASGKKGIPVWKQVVTSLFSWQTALSLGVTLLTVYGKEIGEWIQRLFKGGNAAQEAARKTEAFNKAIESTDYSKAISQVNELEANINAAKEGLLSKEEVLKTYNEGIGKTAGSLETFNELEKWQMDNADKYIQYMFKKAEAQALLQLAVEKTIEAQKKSQNGPGFEDYVVAGLQSAGTQSWFNFFSYAQANALESSADDKLMSKRYLEMFQESQKDVQEYAKANGFDFLGLGDDRESQKKITDSHQQLLDKIAALDAEYARKSFTKDQEELQAIRDKFSKVRELVERFNADPKNKAKRIDLAGFGDLEDNAVADVRFRQETAMMATEISKQKKLFADYEDYKVKFGAEKAKEAYGYQIGEYESYMDYLRSLIDSNQDTYTAITTGDATGGQSERYKVLEEAAEAENAVQTKSNQQLELQNQSHAQRMLVLEENYLIARNRLQEAGKTEEISVLDKKYDEEVKSLETAELKKTEAYKRVFKTVRNMTVKNTKELLAEAEILLEKEKNNADERIKIEERIADLKAQINRGSLEDIFKITGALGELGIALSEIGDSSSGIAQVGQLMSGLASGVGDLLTVLDKDSSNTDKISAGINGVVKLVNIIASSAKQRKDAEADYYRSVIGFQNEYNLSLNEQIRLQSMIGESVFLKDFEGRIKDGLSALKDANEQYEMSLDALSGGRAKNGQKNAIDWGNVGQGASAGAAVGAAIGTMVPIVGNVVGLIAGGLIGGLAGLFGGKKKKDTFVPLLEEYNELIQIGEDGVSRLNRELAETLIANNLVDDSTKQLIEDVLAWEDAQKAAKEQMDSVISDLVGQLGSDVRNSLVDAFRNGEDAALAMGKTVEKVLEEMVSQIIFNKIFSDQFKQLQEEMVASYDDGDGNWIDDFSRFFEASKGLGEDFNQALKDAQKAAAGSGFDIFKPEGSGTEKSGLTGAIKSITSEEAGVLSGLYRATFDLEKRHFNLDEGRLVLEQQHYQATLEGLNYWAAIANNTGNTVNRLDLALVELKEIKKNTKPSSSGFRANGLD